MVLVAWRPSWEWLQSNLDPGSRDYRPCSILSLCIFSLSPRLSKGTGSPSDSQCLLQQQHKSLQGLHSTVGSEADNVNPKRLTPGSFLEPLELWKEQGSASRAMIEKWQQAPSIHFLDHKAV